MDFVTDGIECSGKPGQDGNPPFAEEKLLRRQIDACAEYGIFGEVGCLTNKERDHLFIRNADIGFFDDAGDNPDDEVAFFGGNNVRHGGLHKNKHHNGNGDCGINNFKFFVCFCIPVHFEILL